MVEGTDSVEERLERLERKCRRLRLWCASVTTLFLVACTAAALAPRESTVRAERFEVVGKDGAVRAVLGEILMPGGMGLQVGDPAHGPFAMLGEFPSKDPATGAESRGVILQLESASHPDPNIFSAYVFDAGAAHYLTNDQRSIGSYLEAGRSRMAITTSDPDAADDDADHTRFEVLVEGDKTSLAGSSPSGGLLFRQP